MVKQIKPELIPLDQIVPNVWRDLDLDPLDEKHIAELVASITEHGFNAKLKGRRRDGKVEIGFGHARVAAARMVGLASIEVEINDLNDDQMLRLLIDENALQSGGRASATMNEVAAVLRLLIKGLLRWGEGQSVPDPIKHAFEDRHAIVTARGKVRKRMADPDADVPISYHTILRYFGQGTEKAARRGERQIREAISALKQSGRYDQIIDEAVRKYAPAVAPSDASTAVDKPPVHQGDGSGQSRARHEAAARDQQGGARPLFRRAERSGNR